MPLRIFSSRNLVGANLVQVLGTAGMFGMSFLGTLFLRQLLGYDALQIGLAFLPVAVAMGTLSVGYTDRLVMRFGARATMFLGLALIAAGLALFAIAPAGGGYLVHIFPVTLLIGADGMWLPRPDVAGHVERNPAGRGAGLGPGERDRPDRRRARATRIYAIDSASRSGGLIAQHSPAAAALIDGYHLAFWIACALVAAAAGIGALVLRPRPSLPSAASRPRTSSWPVRSTDRERHEPPGVHLSSGGGAGGSS